MHCRDCSLQTPARRRISARWISAWLLAAAAIPAPWGSAAEPSQCLVDGHGVGTAQKVQVTMTASGNLKVMNQGKLEELPLSVKASQVYTERMLAARPERQSVRWYDKADVQFQIAGDTVRPTLRPKQRLVVVEGSTRKRTLYSPSEPFTRDELDLLDLQANTLLLPLLLPGKNVAVGDRWKPDADLWAQLLGIDAVSNSEVECVLAEVTDGGRVEILVAGAVIGAVEGVATELQVDGSLGYHLKQQQIVDLKLTVREQRAIGHVGPGLDLTCELEMTAQPVTANELPRELTAPVMPMSEQKKALLSYIAPANAFRFTYDRRWHVMHELPNLLSLRLVDKGELVAQCNISPLAPVAPEKVQTAAQFKENVKKAIGEKLQEFTSERETKTADGYRMIRLEAIGMVDSLNVEWHYFLVSDNAGHQIAWGVTLERSLRDRLKNLDGEMVESLRWLTPSDAPGQQPKPAVEAARKPSPAAK